MTSKVRRPEAPWEGEGLRHAESSQAPGMLKPQGVQCLTGCKALTGPWQWD